MKKSKSFKIRWMALALLASTLPLLAAEDPLLGVHQQTSWAREGKLVYEGVDLSATSRSKALFVTLLVMSSESGEPLVMKREIDAARGKVVDRIEMAGWHIEIVDRFNTTWGTAFEAIRAMAEMESRSPGLVLKRTIHFSDGEEVEVDMSGHRYSDFDLVLREIAKGPRQEELRSGIPVGVRKALEALASVLNHQDEPSLRVGGTYLGRGLASALAGSELVLDEKWELRTTSPITRGWDIDAKWARATAGYTVLAPTAADAEFPLPADAGFR